MLIRGQKLTRTLSRNVLIYLKIIELCQISVIESSVKYNTNRKGLMIKIFLINIKIYIFLYFKYCALI